MKNIASTIVIAIGAATLSHSPTSMAQPSQGIKLLIQTPASSFDAFLHQLYIQLNGSKYFEKPDFADSIRVFNINYDPSTNIINLGLHVGERYEPTKNFANLDEEQKKLALISAAKSLAASIGISAGEHPLPIRFGLIQGMKIRHGWGDQKMEDRLKDEIASRIELEVVHAWGSEFAYIAKRSVNGEYSYSKIKK